MRLGFASIYLHLPLLLVVDITFILNSIIIIYATPKIFHYFNLYIYHYLDANLFFSLLGILSFL